MKIFSALVIAGFGLFCSSAYPCNEGTLSTCLMGGVGGLQFCYKGQLGVCTVAPSACGGTQPHDAIVHSVADDGSGKFLGLLCGGAQGDNKNCYSCAAQWIYPAASTAGGVVNCRCL